MCLQQYGLQFPRIHIIIIWLSVTFFVINIWVFRSTIFFPTNNVSLQQWKMQHYRNFSSIVNSTEAVVDSNGAADKLRIVVKSILKGSYWDRWIVEVSNLEERGPLKEDQQFENATITCNLPNLEPWDSYLKTNDNDTKPAKKYDCKKSKGDLIFFTDKESNLVMTGKDIRKDCCYDSVSSPGTCIPITGKITKIPTKQQNSLISVKCQKSESYKQVFALVKKYTKKLRPNLNTTYNVIILGLEGVSLMSFIRNMPLSYDYLTNTLSAISLKGYSKISESPFANLIALHTGGHPKEKVFDQCDDFYDEFDRMDGYPFLFEKVSSRGYYTSYADDYFKKNVFLSHCNYKNLWDKQNQLPTDYFLPHLAKHMEKHNLAPPICYGKETAFSVFLDHIEKMATTFTDERYFQFTWQQMISGSDPRSLNVADQPLLNTLTFLQENGYLDDTVFILMSDQGLKSGKFRDTRQGQLESRNPMAFIVVPPTFPKRYHFAMKNLRENAMKLSTPFDLHETIKSFTDLTRIDDSLLKVRVWETKFRGVSLFLPFSATRTCVAAGIPLHQCRCNARVPYFEDNELTMQAAYFILRKINELLAGNSKCAKIKGGAILSALRFDLDGKDSFNAYEYGGKPQNSKVGLYHQHYKNVGLQIALKTRPCNVVFEASVVKLFNEDWLLSDEMSITSDISSMVNVGNCTGIPEKLIGYCCCNRPT